MLQPMVEKKGCEKVLGDMRDCLVETHCWGMCDEEVQRFQECINTKYFEEIVVEPEVKAEEDGVNEEIVVEPAVKVEEDGVKHEGEVTDEVNSEGDVVGTTDKTGGNELIENGNAEIIEEPVTEEKKVDMSASNSEADISQDVKQEQPVETNANIDKAVDDEEVEFSNESETTKDESSNVDKDTFRIKIVSKSEKEVEEDENLLFKVSVKPNVEA